MKTLSLLLVGTLVFASCTHAIEPVGHDPIPKVKAPLQVWSIVPSWGSFGEEINIHGVGFQNGAKAFLNEKPCGYTIVQSDTLIRCALPKPDRFEDHSVTVVNPDGATAPVPLTQQEMNNLESYDYSDGRIYFYYVKPIDR